MKSINYYYLLNLNSDLSSYYVCNIHHGFIGLHVHNKKMHVCIVTQRDNSRFQSDAQVWICVIKSLLNPD